MVNYHRWASFCSHTRWERWWLRRWIGRPLHSLVVFLSDRSVPSFRRVFCVKCGRRLAGCELELDGSTTAMNGVMMVCGSEGGICPDGCAKAGRAGLGKAGRGLVRRGRARQARRD